MSTIKTFIELHIEQGPHLEREKTDIGLVEYLPGIGRYIVKFNGKLDDSTAPMHERQDAYLAASKFTVEVNKIINSLGDGITGTVGEINISPNSHQFVPDFAELSVEVRTMDTKLTNEIDLSKDFLKAIQNIEAETNVNIEIKERSRIAYSNPTPPSVMDVDNINVMEEVCQQLGYSYRKLNKGTGHDAMIMTDFVPTNMIYVPSKNGATHNPDEWTEYEELQKGIDLMLFTVERIAKSG